MTLTPFWTITQFDSLFEDLPWDFLHSKHVLVTLNYGTSPSSVHLRASSISHRATAKRDMHHIGLSMLEMSGELGHCEGERVFKVAPLDRREWKALEG